MGAIAGVVIGAAGDSVGIADVNNDRKKDSLVDMVKIGIDSVCDWFGDLGRIFEWGKRKYREVNGNDYIR